MSKKNKGVTDLFSRKNISKVTEHYKNRLGFKKIALHELYQSKKLNSLLAQAQNGLI